VSAQNDPSPRELMEFAIEAAWLAGKITLEYFQTPFELELKADASPVTIADRRAEHSLREAISRRYPDHAIVGEEEGETGPPNARHRWVLDPIDGTASFVRGVPLYGVLVAVERDGESIVGVVNLPALGETVYAARGEGAYWNGRRARVSNVDRLEDALVLATGEELMTRFGRGPAYARLRDGSKMQRTWGDCYGHVLVATGRADVMLDPIMNLWDNAALLPILWEAGGTFTDWSGNATHTAPEALSTNGALYERVLAEIRAVGEETR
jgi:histidinol phosphatase-like enzyme (inositol monophosphatase family)